MTTGYMSSGICQGHICPWWYLSRGYMSLVVSVQGVHSLVVSVQGVQVLGVSVGGMTVGDARLLTVTEAGR